MVSTRTSTRRRRDDATSEPVKGETVEQSTTTPSTDRSTASPAAETRAERRARRHAEYLAGFDAKEVALLDKLEKERIAQLPPSSEVYKHISKYAKADWGRALFELAWTVAAYSAMVYYTADNWWWTPVCGLFRIRIFIIFHDMGHNSFFPSRFANKWVGVFVGALALTPHSYWTKGHNYHHKHSNNLDKHQYAQTAPWTAEQYENASRLHRFVYNFIYGPWTLFTTTPWLYFTIIQRLVSRWYENTIVFAVWALEYYMGGWTWVIYDLLSGYFGALYGFLLFHAQHTFEKAYKARTGEWNYYVNGMIGSSYFMVPSFLKLFTAGIEYHHIHHLNALVPSYRIRQCHEESGSLFAGVPKISLAQEWRSLSYSVWVEPLKMFDTVMNH